MNINNRNLVGEYLLNIEKAKQTYILFVMLYGLVDTDFNKCLENSIMLLKGKGQNEGI